MAENKASATLVAPCGAIKVERDTLITLPTPPRTTTFMPIPHNTLVDMVENNLTAQGYGIQKAEFAVQNGKLDGKPLAGAKLFASFVLKHPRDDFAFALGLRAANDKSMAIEL